MELIVEPIVYIVEEKGTLWDFAADKMHSTCQSRGNRRRCCAAKSATVMKSLSSDKIGSS